MTQPPNWMSGAAKRPKRPWVRALLFIISLIVLCIIVGTIINAHHKPVQDHSTPVHSPSPTASHIATIPPPPPSPPAEPTPTPSGLG